MGIRKWVGSLVGKGSPPAAPEAAATAAAAPAAPAPLPALAQLDALSIHAPMLKIVVAMEQRAGLPAAIEMITMGGPAVRVRTSVPGTPDTYRTTQTLSEALRSLAAGVPPEGLFVVKVVSRGCTLDREALARLCTIAVYEGLGRTPPADEIAAEEEARKEYRDARAKEKALRKELLALLAGGADGVAAWNARRKEAQRVSPFKKADLTGKDLTGAHLVDMPGARLAGATLTSCDLRGHDLSQADLTRAVLRGARADKANLHRADLTGAVLDGASLVDAEVRGAIFAGASIEGVQWKNARFDERTVWPEGFVPADAYWFGKGPSPAALAAISARKKAEGPIDVKTLMERLGAAIEKGRFSKALSMLKQDHFQLFAEVGADALAGVVKSQNDPDLVYACTLSAGGTYSCCTQNLNVCGGLRGALCKHLLVLIMGLAQAGQVEADTVDEWVQRSALHLPELQKEAAGTLLLRYKGAEAGEIDWRPTETVPEDFYAY